jgi:hypothetical protein
MNYWSVGRATLVGMAVVGAIALPLTSGQSPSVERTSECPPWIGGAAEVAPGA